MALDSFFDEPRLNAVYTDEACHQRRIRIRLALAAYAYEYHDAPIMSDAEFDKMSLEVDTSIETGNPEIDEFYRKFFDPSTGGWIHSHPERYKIEWIYKRYFES